LWSLPAGEHTTKGLRRFAPASGRLAERCSPPRQGAAAQRGDLPEMKNENTT